MTRDSAFREGSERTDRTLAFWGTLGTLVYAGAAAVWLLLRWSDFAPLTPNEWGDWLAGTVAPVAFLWFILGYFQQGLELRQNTQALKLQYRELKSSVEEQHRLVEAAMRQALASEESIALARRSERPRFVYDSMDAAGSDGGGIAVSFVNRGGDATVTRILSRNPGVMPQLSSGRSYAGRGDRIAVTLPRVRREQCAGQIFQIHFDGIAGPGCNAFEITGWDRVTSADD
jgi:hypothetical protein